MTRRLQLCQSSPVKRLQLFLGFANFYRCFIWGFNSVVAPFMDLLRGKLKKIRFSDTQWEAFKKVKKLFTSAPVLKLPNPALMFIVMVEASELVIGAGLSQRH